jgi:uncharacterized protein YrrD
MIKAQSVIGKAVLSRADGEKLDSVKDVIIGTDHTRVIALLINEGGLFSKALVVQIENVVSFGKDAVVVTDSKVAMRADHVPAVAQALDMDEKLGGKKVFSETGDEHGKLSDIYFDEKTGQLEGVDVTDLGPGSSSKDVAFLDMSDVISFGADAVVITASAVSKLTSSSAPPDHASTSQPGGTSVAGRQLESEATAVSPTDIENEAPYAARVSADMPGMSPTANAGVTAQEAGSAETSTPINHAKPADDPGSGSSGTEAGA